LVRPTSEKYVRRPKPPYRPAALNEDQTGAGVAFFENGHCTPNYVAQRDVLGSIETNPQKCLSYQWIASFLKKHANLIGRSVGRPQENVRLKVPHEYLGQYIRLTKEYVPLVPTELLFDIDESSFNDWKRTQAKMRSNRNKCKGNDSPLPCEPENSSSDIGLLCYGRWGCMLSSSSIIGPSSTGSI
jgi:hypothetical protein